jgi:hypothetical protein
VTGSETRNEDDGGKQPKIADGDTRPQRAGEAETTRFGMEDGDNTDTPGTGGQSSDQESADRE